ncbi:MAG: glycoside hydrolase family 16 protein [Atopobiaceae bacterium]|nr:glycoside hydrolase family 16 protein [Atopobiaceae bacterium]
MNRLSAYILEKLPTLLPLHAIPLLLKRSDHAKRMIDGRQYRLTFEDDFDGKRLNPIRWSPCPRWRRQDVGGYWDSSMVSVRDGCLVLGAGLSEDGTPISGAIRSKGRFSQRDGYFAARCRLQSASGFWASFWLMDAHYDDDRGIGTEIDVFESFWAGSGVNQAVHWGGYGKHMRSATHTASDPSMYEGFHVFALEWTDSEYIFYIDGKETWRTSEPGSCTDELYLKMTNEFGTGAGPIYAEQLPDEVLVDWIRVYKRV